MEAIGFCFSRKDVGTAPSTPTSKEMGPVWGRYLVLFLNSRSLQLNNMEFYSMFKVKTPCCVLAKQRSVTLSQRKFNSGSYGYSERNVQGGIAYRGSASRKQQEVSQEQQKEGMAAPGPSVWGIDLWC